MERTGKMKVQRPKILTPRVESIPAALKERCQWVNWLLVPRNGRWTKHPKDPHTGEMASTTDPATWGLFDDCIARMDHNDGVGFVFTRDDSFVGVDLDKCRNVETGQMQQWAEQIVSEIDSYTEVSPSGTGVHIIARGKLPERGRRRGLVEMYESDRYFCFTGHTINGSAVEHRQDRLESLHRKVFAKSQNGKASDRNGSTGATLSNDEIVEKATAAKNGEKFRRLWGGDTTGYASHSEADVALCGMLAFYIGPDPDRVDALFRQSGLYRDKWERDDYRAATIDQAIQGRTGSTQRSRRRPMHGVEGKARLSTPITVPTCPSSMHPTRN